MKNRMPQKINLIKVVAVGGDELDPNVQLTFCFLKYINIRPGKKTNIDDHFHDNMTLPFTRIEDKSMRILRFEFI
ncbi:hypothetical protein DERP_003809 [Dermatophagoides pteronyssinus]|uniref:Uncharacterized protein n=1 Tax=Dermatophagoides pteronyssinus TaxID=6956 RepID=A0ABQ8JM96_DERPT|nr:hypothetical protein DERP_003809 [Dermatophagoides pteronyssinus]